MTYTHGDRIQLRPATSADGPEVAALFIASRHDALPYLPELHTDESTTQWISETVLRHSTVWVAELDGIIVGFSSLVGDHLDHLYVRPGHYRQGVGDRLLARAKAMSSGRLRLFTFQRNARARAFYEARAFVVIAYGDGSTNEEREPDVLYEWIAPSTAASGPDPSAGRPAGDDGHG